MFQLAPVMTSTNWCHLCRSCGVDKMYVSISHCKNEWSVFRAM